MASHFRQLNLNREYCSMNGVDVDVMKNNIDGYMAIDSTIEQLRQAFHKSLDLNRPMVDTIIQEEHTISNIYHKKVENAKRKLAMEMKASQDDEVKITTFDLNLSLSVPGANNPKQDSPSNPSELKSSSSSSPSTDERSCMSVDFNSDSPDPKTPQEMITDDDDGIPSLILMGCSRCMMYVMVSEAEPSCPKCKTTVLIDQFRSKPAKRCRRN